MVSASVEKRADVIMCCVMHVNMFIACILCFVLVQNFPLIDSVGLVSVSPVTHARHVTRSFVARCQCVPQEFTPQPQTISPTSPEDGDVVSSNVSESDSLDRLVLFKEGLIKRLFRANFLQRLSGTGGTVLSDLLKTGHGQHRAIYGRDVSCVS